MRHINMFQKDPAIVICNETLKEVGADVAKIMEEEKETKDAA